MKESIERRLNRLERSKGVSPYAQAVNDMISSGKLYNDLTEAEKDIYAKYHGAENHAVYEEIETIVCGTVPQELKRRKKPKRIAEAIDEVQQIIAELI